MNDIVTDVTDARQDAVQESNWLIFVIGPPDPMTGKRSKHPTDQFSPPEGGRGCNWGDPVSVYEAARYTFAAANDLIAQLGDGYAIGYLPRPGSAMVLGDLDNCRDPMTGTLTEWAQEILSMGQTYVEISTSRTGLRVLMARQESDDTHSSAERRDVGFFSNGKRGAVLTFNPLNGAAHAVQAAPALRDAILARRGLTSGRKESAKMALRGRQDGAKMG